MRTRSRKSAWALWLGVVAVAALLGACSDDEGAATASAPAETSGGEDANAAMTAQAKPMAKREAVAAPGATPTTDTPPRSDTPQLAPVPTLVAVDPDPGASAGPSPWGAPEGESAKPLPKRASMGKKAVDPYKQGLAALAAGDSAAAKQAFLAANAADPKSYQVEYNLGVVADRQGQPDEALQRYGKALRLQPDYELAVQGAVNIMLRRNNTAGAVAYVEPIARQWERNLYLQAILADTLTRADRVDEAEQVARKALRRDERFVPAIVSLSKASARRGRKELAESMLAQASEIDPNYAEAHFLRGKDFQAKGELAQALAAYRKAVELRPDYAEARMALGIQFMASGNYTEALSQFEAAAKLVSTLPATYVNLGDAYRALKRWQDAKREFDKALRMQPQLPEAHFNLALMYMAAGATFPSLTELEALDRALLEFNTYRTQLGPGLKSDDPSTAYMADIQRRIEREKKRIEREKAKAEKDAQRKAREASGTTPAKTE